MKKFYFLICISFLSVLAKAQQVNFSYTPSKPSVDDTVSFKNLSVGFDLYKWKFGDGTTSTDANPDHVYKITGSYNVQLVATDASGSSDSVLIKIPVLSKILAEQLISFSGSQSNGNNILAWSTTSITSILYFGIEKSTDGIHFTELAQVPAKGSNSNTTQYSYVEKAVISRNNYYRLKTVNKNGGVTFSTTIQINSNSATFGNLLFPNPVKQNQQSVLKLSLERATSAQLVITNTAGKLLKTQTLQLSAGENAVNLAIAGFTTGTYYVSCTTRNKPIFNAKLLIIR